MESDIRFYRRRANEELAAANRAVTASARERRMIMAGIFLEKLKALDPSASAELNDQAPVFNWAKSAERA
jgi:hypothetical protein